MPRHAPTPEMLTFASKLGGVLVRDAELPFGRHVTADPAFAFALQLLEDFSGTRNADGLTFQSDVQMLDSVAAYAMTGHVRGRFCIGVTAGYTARIAEISGAVIQVLCMGLDSGRQTLLGLANAAFQAPKAHSQPDTSFTQSFDVLVRSLHGAGHSSKHLYLSNLLLLFALLREIRYAVDGHVLYLARANKLTARERGTLQSFAALDVDCDAFGFVVTNLLRELPIFNVTDRDFTTTARLTAFQLGIMLLAAVETDPTTRIDGRFGELTSTDRAINFTSLPVRLAMAMPESWDELLDIQAHLSRTLSAIASMEPRLQAIASPLDGEAVERHERMAERLMASSAVRQARSVMSGLVFAPKTMPVG
jgi:hypothetical protein